jgi:hypothetical protein
MLYALTPTGAIVFYAGLNVIAFCLIFLFLPETRLCTLEELDYVFGVPTKKFIAYNFRVALPWWWKRWVLFDKSAKLEPLYRFDGVDNAPTQSDSETETRTSEGRTEPEKSTATTKDV